MWGEVATERTPLRSTATEAGCVPWLDCAHIFCSVALAGGEATYEVYNNTRVWRFATR